MEGFDIESTCNMKNYNKDKSPTEGVNSDFGDPNSNNKVREENITVDCVHLNVDEDLEEECVSLNVEKDISEAKESFKMCDIRIHNEGLLPLVWPDNVQLYEPVDGQLLFSEMPNCLYVKTFLQMCNLQYTLVQKTNADYIGPTREVPVLKCGKYIVSGAEEIIKFVEAKGISLTSNLEDYQKTAMAFYISLVKMTLAKAEHFITWLDPETYRNVTRSRFCSVHPWPLGPYLLGKIKPKMQNKLDAMGCGQKTLEDVCEEMDLCLRALSDKLEENYFFGNQPTKFDALVFAHVYTIMTNPLPKSQFIGIIHGYPKVVKHCYKVMEHLGRNSSNQFAELLNNIST